MAATNVQAFPGDVTITDGLAVSKDIESTNSFITERVLFKETWPNGHNSLSGDLGTWVITNLTQQSNPSSTTTPDGYTHVSFNGDDSANGEFTSPAFDLSDYAIVDGTLQANDKRKTTTRVFMKFWLGSRQLDVSGEVVKVQFSPDNGSTWYTVATSQDRTNIDRFTMVSADLSPYILETSTNAKIRFYLPWTVASGDYLRIGRIWIHESDVPTNLGGMWLGAAGKIGIGTDAPESILHLSASTASADITDPIKIKIHNRRGAGDWSITQPWGLLEFDTDDTGTAGSGPVAGIGCRFEQDGGGDSSICFYTDAVVGNDNVLGTANERMCINSDGLVGIGTVTPRAKLDIYTGATTSAGLILDRYATGNYRTELYQGSYGLDIKVGYAAVEPASVVHVERFSATSTRLRIDSPGCLRNDGGVEVANYNDITGVKQIWDTGSRFRIFADNDSKLLFSSAGGNGTLADTTALSIHNGNLVGIGTTSSTRTLSVNGSFMADIGGGRTFGTTSASSATPNDTTGSGTTKHKGTFFMSLTRYTTATNRPIYFGSGDDSDTTVVIGTTGGAGGAGFQNTMLKLTGSGYLYVKKVYANNSELSDDRLKINEEPIQNATKTILKLNPLVYDKYEKLSDLTSNVFEVESGLMVQDVWYDTPELRHIVEVPDDANPMETKEEDPEYTNWGSKPAHLTYTQLLPYIIKSIQEIHNENGKLKIQISGAHSPNMIVCKSPTTDTVSLCNKEYDSTCIGVLSDTNSSEVLIETRGLGNIWVVNTNGNLTPGDYITTSNVSGYGQKQNSEFLANYTVAKITEPCDFTDIYKPVKRIIQQLEDVNYYGTTKNILVNEEIYNTLPENERHIETCTSLEDEIENTTIDYYKILYTESKYNREGAETITRQELVNVLDEHGQIQWEDHATETEKAYKIRYLDANGVITDEANAVHTAAFVGCTYHCG